ncbi:MAG: mechanosensitive ion channel family protein [Gemmatimonadaceae bacterium]
MLWGADTGEGQAPADTTPAAETTFVTDTTSVDTTQDVSAAVGEATSTLRELGRGAYRLAPKIGIALGLLVAVAFITHVVRALLRRASRSWQRAQGFSALISVVLWLLAIGAALAILAGDARALLGSVGLVGLALSWALQAPIESFTGWLLNSFRSYYRVGDRIAVGDVFGDVYAIDLLTTTVWEAGGEHKAVQGAQPTGALITFPNSEVLRANIINYTRDFSYVWDEIVVGISNESDLQLAIEIIREVAESTIGREMAVPVATYANLLRHARLPQEVSDKPQLYISPTDAWMNITVRYLVEARQRRRAASELHQAIAERLAQAPYRSRIKPSYPRMEVAVLGPSTASSEGEER